MEENWWPGFLYETCFLTCWALYIAFTTRDHRARRHHRATSLSSLKERKRRRPYIAVVVVPYRSTHTGL